MIEFKNRKAELRLLNNLYEKGDSKLVVVYGRRRVGKTELLREFLKKHKGLYILARQESELEQLKKLSSQIAEYYNDRVLKINHFSSWDALFTYLSEKPRIPIVFDEFPYLVQSSKRVPGILQDYWDNRFSKKNAFIILCGSSINMMERLLGHKSPLYGRRTEQLLLEPMKFDDAILFFPGHLSLKERILNYAVLGGMPAYLLEFDFSKGLKENIMLNILRKNKLLYNDVLFTLREELKEPRNYFSILYSISKGSTRMGQIVNDTGLQKSFVNKYLSVLIDLQLIERRVPITERNPRRSRNGIYLIKDNFFKFWFRFVFENQEYIEQEKQEKLFHEKIEPELNSFTGRIFEAIVLEVISGNKTYNNYLWGRWWDKNEEVDLVGIDRENKKILIGEIKLNKLNKKEAFVIKASLEAKAKKINNFEYEQSLILICLDCDEKIKEHGFEVVNFSELVKKE